MKKINCVVCNNSVILTVLDLGKSPLANNLVSFKNAKLKEKKYPLVMGQCSKCNHVQLKYFINPKLMFDNYLYVSSASITLQKHLQSIPTLVNKVKKINKNDLVIDIGSNDGSLLGGYKKYKTRCIGVEPALNLMKFYKNTNIINYNNYFDIKLAKKILSKHGKAKIITATNVFPHIPNLHEFCKALKILMDEKGIFVFEAHYLLNLLEDVAFDTIYHEHVSYWSINAAQKLFRKHGLEIFKVDRLSIHHGQIRCWIGREGMQKIDKKLNKKISYENKKGKIDRLGLKRFKDQVINNKKKLLSLLKKKKKLGKLVVGYGAPAKACTLLTYLGLKKKDIPFIVDKNPLKQNCFIPGSRIPIYPVEEIYKKKPDFLINFAWNFLDEIILQNKKFLASGGKIINPIPKLKILK
jgi:predicted TPR repeat methyltransferase